MYKLFGHFSLTLSLLSATLYAGSFADFKRVQNESFSKFKDEKDREFSNYLKEQWQEYTNYSSMPMYEKPKPKSIVSAIPQKIEKVGPSVRVKIEPTTKKSQEPVVPKLVGDKDIVLNYFGTQLGFNIDRTITQARYYPHNQKGVANFFTQMASSNYEDTLEEIRIFVKSMELNDWALYLLVKKLSHKVFDNEDEAKLLQWFLLNKLSYNVKIALSSQHVLLLTNTNAIVYATPSYRFSNKKFYLLGSYNNVDIRKIYTYPQNYPNADRALDFSLTQLPLLNEDIQTKKLVFSENSKEYSAEFTYNKNMIEFMATYPQVDYSIYFNAPMEPQTYRDIAKDLKKYVDGKKASVAIDFILKFVQKSFIYEVDQEQFSKEKVMFAEETLVYEKSDCEDRAILFSYLIKKLLGISVVGVKYPNHMATALYIPIEGDSVKIGKRRYVIADPTYINANVGQSMPKYRSIQPKKFILVK